MIYAELQQDTLAWQRALKFAGMYRGKLDGLTGPLTREAAANGARATSSSKPATDGWTSARRITCSPSNPWPRSRCAR